MSLFLIFAASISCIFADTIPNTVTSTSPATDAIAAPLATAPIATLLVTVPVATPANAPAVVTARSYQVFARNYYALTASSIPAPLVSPAPLPVNTANLAAPLLASAPIIAAETSPVAQTRTSSAKSEKRTLEQFESDQSSRSSMQTENLASKEGSMMSSNDAVASVAANHPVVPSTIATRAPYARQSIFAPSTAIVARPAAYTPVPYMSYPLNLPFVTSPYFSSAYYSPNYVRFD